MSETIEYEQFDEAGQGAPSATAPGADADLRRLAEIPMELAVELGRKETTVGETLDLRVGSLVELERDAGAPADLLVNGTPIARGEVVVVDERYGLRITEILDAQQQQGASAGVPSPAGEGLSAPDEPDAQAHLDGVSADATAEDNPGERDGGAEG